jgi:hypothetical protein
MGESFHLDFSPLAKKNVGDRLAPLMHLINLELPDLWALSSVFPQWESFCVLASRERWTQYFLLAPLAAGSDVWKIYVVYAAIENLESDTNP